MDATEVTRTNGANRVASPWEAEILRRWTHLQEAIAETDYDLAQTRAPQERGQVDPSFHLLKRAALSVWVDARRLGLSLPDRNGVPLTDPYGGAG